MLTSTAALLLAAGHGGLIVHIDYARLAEARRPPAEARSGFYYSKAAVLDAYEVLRQFIDATDELRGVLLLGDGATGTDDRRITGPARLHGAAAPGGR